MTEEKIRLGTRTSPLALAQTELAKEALLKECPGLSVEVVGIQTTGDHLLEASLTGGQDKGLFTKEIEDALLNGTIDAAVHSLKDLPVTLPPGLVLGAHLPREDARDVLFSRFGEQLKELPKRSVIGTSSLRRQAQLAAVGRQYRAQDIRGNVQTRLNKLKEGKVDALVLAMAGVKRLGLEEDAAEVLSFEDMLPAPAQGVVALECREDDMSTREVLGKINNISAWRESLAERSFLDHLGGGCRVPIAAYAHAWGNDVLLRSLVISLDGKKQVRLSASGPVKEAENLGRALAEESLLKGAGDILKSAAASS